MWRNIFLESCLLSALIFGGFYLNSVNMKNDLSAPPQSEHSQVAWDHISGKLFPKDETKSNFHVSGSGETSSTKADHLFN